MKGIDRLRKKEIKFGVLCVLSKNNINNMEDIFNFFVSEGLLYVPIEPFFPAGRGEVHKELSITSNELFQAMKILYNKINEYNTNKDDDSKFKERNISELISNIIYDERGFMCKRSPCGATFDTLGFNPNGDVYPCDNFAGISEFKLGNIIESSLNEILNDNPIVERFRNCTVENTTCCNCPWKYICCGGRVCHAYFVSGRVEDKDCYCDYNKKIIHYFMKLIGEDKLKVENFLF